MALKQVNRSATVAFAPMGNVMACGTQAGAIDLSFSSSTCLELFKLDFESGDSEPPLVGATTSTERFHRLSWGTTGIEDGTYPYGIIAGGLVDGSVNLWNPGKMMSGRQGDAEGSLIKKLQKHQGAVRGLEFNMYSPNLLASGAEDGVLCIWDLADPSAPTLYPELKGGGGNQAGEISYLSWNHKVQHILASTSFNGTSVVWDLRKQKPVLSFTDTTSRRPCSALQWSPDVATQLVVASDDDRSPSLQVWDLRNSVSPARELTAHVKGVLAMAWCPSDSALLLSCAKDNRTLCWDTVSGEVLCELPANNNWNFDLKWNPRIPGVLSTSSFDGKISLYNIESCASPSGVENEFTSMGERRPPSVMRRAPNWLKRPVGASFGFGGKLVSFGPRKSGPGQPGTLSSEVCIHNVVTEEALLERSAKFEEAVAGSEKEVMKSFCQSKAAVAMSEEEKETWSFLGVLFEDDARRKLLAHLDFNASVAENGVVPEATEALAADVGNLAVVDGGVANGAPTTGAAEAAVPGLDPEEFFNNLQAPATPPAPVIPAEKAKSSRLSVDTSAAPAEAVAGQEQEENNEDTESEKAIQRALVVGNYELAVQHCLAANRMADALVLASVGGAALWTSVQNEFMQRNRRPYMKVVSAVINNDMKGLVASRPTQQWKETLALLCTYARSEEWTGLCDALALRLDSAGNTQDAILCYICAGNIERAVEIWARGLKLPLGSPSAVEALQDVMEKAVVLGMATGQKRESGALSKLVGSYAELLAGQGRLATALEYLTLVPGEQSSQELAVLRDRIYRSGQVLFSSVEPPPFPFEAQELQPPPAVYTAPTPSYPQQQVVQPTPHSQMREASKTYDSYPAQPQTQPAVQQRQAHMPFIPPPVNAPTYQSYTQPPPLVAPPQPVQTYQHQQFVPVAGPSIHHPEHVPPQVQPTIFTPVQPPQSTQQQFVPVAGPPIHHPEAHQAPPAAPPSVFTPHMPQTQAAPVQPPTPVSPPAAAVQQAPPVGPPPTVQTADTSNVPAELRPVVASLTRLYNETAEAGGARANPAKKREIEDNSRKLGALFTKLNASHVSANVGGKLQQLCQALNAGDFATALHVQVGLTTSDWDECSAWVTALRRMIKARQTMR
eukprot:TRINITY_DN18571_c0_g2_i1.p1 TRINITY_DN18571_c0_g2~~TRINITY_DN18571_c0_g2_i1.p1  ORF type:complete len:1125 (-),score=228.11 TRINITY_DN18571_c0_g2_i1:535-3909(-)